MNEPLNEPLVRVRELSVAYRAGDGEVPVVRGVSFDVRPHRTHAVVGESGSGKSTVAAALLGHLRHGSRVTGGSIEIAGQDVFSLPPKQLAALRGATVAMVAQNAGQALTPSMRIGRQISETGNPNVLELLEQVRLPHPAQLARRYPHELSGGQQQRVAIAMALAARPLVLVLDEPTTGLDVVTQDAILALLRDLAGELGLATVLVSHDLGVVERMADDVTVMRAGAVVETRPVADLFGEPSDGYTKRLLASVPRLTDGGLAVVGEDGTRSVRPRATPDPAAPVLVSARDVRVRYRSGTAVDGVSLDLRRGEVLALVGESGSGKSTLAWALAGLRSADGGTMRYQDGADQDGADQDGADLTVAAARRSREVRRKVALVFQNADTSLNPRRSVGSAVRRPLRLFRHAGRRDAGARVRQLFTDVHLDEGFVSRLPGQLSGGQRQRVGIARALAGEPEVVIADEITTALDVSVQAATLQLFDDLRRDRQLACLFISHDLAVVRGMADRVAVLWQGRVVEEGPTEAVFERPAHPYTRSLRAAAEGTGEQPVVWAHDESTTDVWVELGEGHRYRRWKGSA